MYDCYEDEPYYNPEDFLEEMEVSLQKGCFDGNQRKEIKRS